MFKLVVLSALLGAAVAKPGFLSPLLAPTTYAATIAAPVSTSTYVQHSSYVAPTVYSGISYPHFIKKRSPQFYSAYAPFYSSYLSPSSYYNYPPTASYYPSYLPGFAAPAHFIKKRSAPLLTSAQYIAPALTPNYFPAAPVATTYPSSYIPSWPYYSPFYSNYFSTLPLIKK